MPRKLQIRQDDVNLPVDLATAKRAKYAVATTSVALAASSGVDSLGNAYRPNDKVITLSDGAFTVGIAESQVALSTNTLTVATVNALPATPQRPNYFVSSNRLVYAVTVDGYVTNGVSYVSTDAEWAAMTQMIDGQIVHHRGRGATYTYDKPTASWSWRSGSTSKPKTGIIDTLTARAMYCLDSRAGQEVTRTVNGTARLADHSQRGDVRQMRTGGCLTTNGVNDYATAVTNIDFGGPELAATCWVKAGDIIGFARYLAGSWDYSSNQRVFLLAFEIDGRIGAYVSADYTTANFMSILSTAAVDDNAWHHVAFSFSRGVLKFYVDGVDQGVASTTGTVDAVVSGPVSFRIAAKSGTVANTLGCSVGDIRIFDKALTPAQIKDLAALAPGSYRGVDGLPVPLLAYDFEDPTLSPFCRNKGSLGSKGDLTITTGSLATVRGSTFPGYCFANEFGYSPSFVTDGSGDYIDTGITLDGATAFTVWRRMRYLSNTTYGLDGFRNAGGSAVRLGRYVLQRTQYYNFGDDVASLGDQRAIPDGRLHTMAISSSVGGTEKSWIDGVPDISTAASMSAISNAELYTIGMSDGGMAFPANAEYYEYLIAKRVLTDAELTWLDTKGHAGTPIDFLNDPDILLYYDFKDQHPTLVRNLANPSNPGRIVGGQWGAVQQSYSAGQDVDQVDYAYRSALYGAGGDYLDFGRVLIPATDNFDISFDFIKFDAVASVYGLFQQYTLGITGRLLVTIRESNQLRLFIAGEPSLVLDSPNGVVIPGKWHHLRIVRAGHDYTMYLDGVLIASGTVIGLSVEQVNSQLIGANNSGFVGLLSNVTVNGETFLTEPDETISGATLVNGASYVNVVRGKPGTLEFKGRAPRDPIVNSPCVTLNGSNEFLTLPVDLSDATSWSFSCRVKTVDTSAMIMDSRDGDNDGYRIFWGFNTLYVSSDAADIAFAGASIDNGEWRLIEVEWDGSTVSASVDGVSLGSGAMAPAASQTRANVIVGKNAYASSELLSGQVAEIAMTVNGLVVGKWPLCDGAGKYALDVSGNGNHGEITGTLSAIWANTQPVFNYLTEAGWSPATWFDGTNDWFVSSANVTGASAALSLACKFSVDNDTDRLIIGESTVSSGSYGWYIGFLPGNKIRFFASNNGSSFGYWDGDVTGYVGDGGVHTLSCVYSNGAPVIKIDGSVIALTVTNAAGGNIINPSPTGRPLAIGSRSSGDVKYAGILSQIVLEAAAWTPEEVTSLLLAGKASEVAAIRPNAWYFPAGDSNETLQNVGGWTTNGSPEPRYIPGGAGVPVIYQNQLAPTQSLSLDCGEANSPFALKFAGILSDLTYNQGDGSEAAHWFVRTPEDADDRLQLFETALSGFDLSAITFDLNN